MTQHNQHHPVMLEEALSGLNIQSNGYYIDGTLGRGGHARAILDRLSDDGRLLVMDKDPQAIAFAEQGLAQDPRVSLHHGSFTDMRQVADSLAWRGKVAGILLDLGVSSPQLDDPQRGFSFKQSGPLDMRMNTAAGISAAQWLAHAEASEIAQVLKAYGEERFAKRIANAIVSARQEAPIDTTQRLAGIIAAANPKHEKGKDPATRSFQAIRIFINQELDDIKATLAQVIDLLAPGGRLVVISFHSLEDRLIKRFIREQSRGDDFPPDLPITHVQLQPKLKAIGKAQYATEAEVRQNVRARSAVLRVAERMA
ncbi:MAG: 16S rRNA (cytosine(1402)-N(4))-methyltransferase RsmH [Gammaproteobacteria bacterium]